MSAAFIMPILAVVFVLVLAVAVIVVGGNIIAKRQAAISQKSFADLAKEIRQENAEMKAELLGIKEKVSSMDKMMKDI